MTMTLPANGFAKLLATENIDVRYDGGATTATFDTETRVLTMPMWKDMSRQLNDMLIGHEVGHALFTAMNAAEIVAFLKSVDSKHMDRVMQYLNVVEDARIDRLIQRKFPNLRKDYWVGYPEMMDRGFFGPMDADHRPTRWLTASTSTTRRSLGSVRYRRTGLHRPHRCV